MKIKHLLPTLGLLFVGCEQTSNTDWAHYLGDPATSHYSKLDQINVENVTQLQVAWTYRSSGGDSTAFGEIQCNPLIINGVLYGISPQLQCFAVDAATGKELWRFDPFADVPQSQRTGMTRGLAHWHSGQESRLLLTAGPFLYALNVKTGKPFADFGTNGKVDLHEGLGREVGELYIAANTPGVVYEDLYILGMRVSEATGAAPGHIRAFNVRTGKQAWIFHTIPQPGETGYETWPPDAWQRIGGANSWAGMSLDEKRGWVFVPTGSASYDFYGGDRAGDNLFANCILALNAKTGKRIWHYQTVHHDVWDRDLPCAPNLTTLEINGKKIDAVVQPTKSGYLFVLDRETGKPLFPIEEVAVEASTLKGEKSAKTQPIPTKPVAFARNKLDSNDLNNLTPADHAYALNVWKKSRNGVFVPPTLEGTLIFPGFDGGAEWGGSAVDPTTNLIYINANEMAWVLQMLPYEATQGSSQIAKGKNIYQTQCMNCHGKDLKGASIFKVPSLLDVKNRYSKAEILNLVKGGKRAMPSFAYLSDTERDAVVSFVMEGKGIEPTKKSNKAASQEEDLWTYPYVMSGYNRFKTPSGFPAISPPWGTLNAIDLNTGEMAWKIPFGEHPKLVEKGIRNTGSENYGGPVVTAGGLVFIAATLDEKFHAFDKRTGKLLWETTLPAAGHATPATYSVNGKQYVVIACGGGKLDTQPNDTYVAFALPNNTN